MIATFFTLAALSGTLTTLAFAMLIYATSQVGFAGAGWLGAAATLATFATISHLFLSSSDHADAGSMALHAAFILVASVIGGVFGTLFCRFCVEGVRRRS